MYTATVYQFGQAFLQYILGSGLLTDELSDGSIGASAGAQAQNGLQVSDALDERILPEASPTESQGALATNGITQYNDLQGVRAFANQAIGALAVYDTGARTVGNPTVLRAELYAREGYIEIMLADFFCSGIPLSTLDFQHDFTYHAGLTTVQVYQDAIAKFDTALTLAGDSSLILNLARVGRGRAYLDLGQFDSAAAAVATVPDGFAFIDTLVLSTTGAQTRCLLITCNGSATVSNHEGANGLPYISSDDPRTRVVYNTINTYHDSLFSPLKYISAETDPSGSAPVTVADWIEVRLIRAEVALQMGDVSGWLTQLNYLRKNATVPGMTDTLTTLVDPGSDSTRVSLLFRERAYWLFLTGHRQGDLRRALRQYNQYQEFQSQQQVYPTGLYHALGVGVYGSDVTVPIPPTEYANPLFHGCLSRDP